MIKLSRLRHSLYVPTFPTFPGFFEAVAGRSFAEINQRLSSIPREIAEATQTWESASLELEELKAAVEL